MIGLTLGRYLSWRFLETILTIFVAISGLSFLIDFIEMLRRAGDVPGARAGFVALMSFLRVPSVSEQILPFAVLFGTMAAFAAVGMPLLDAKARRRLGRPCWDAMSRNTSVVPFAALLGGRARGDGLHRLVLPAAAAGLLYAWILLQGHALLIGPEPLASLRAFD